MYLTLACNMNTCKLILFYTITNYSGCAIEARFCTLVGIAHRRLGGKHVGRLTLSAPRLDTTWRRERERERERERVYTFPATQG